MKNFRLRFTVRSFLLTTRAMSIAAGALAYWLRGERRKDALIQIAARKYEEQLRKPAPLSYSLRKAAGSLAD